METLVIIPARSGSKSVKDKNIRLINGKPLLAYSICHAKSAYMVNRVIVSTDSSRYAEIAKGFGAEVPFLRPKEISGDSTLDIEVFQHALDYLRNTEGYVPDIVVQLRPTYPIRNVIDINAMVQLIIDNPDIDSVRCIAPAKEIAYKMWNLNSDGTINPIMTDMNEAYNMPRQELPQIYYQNACIDVVRASVITELNSMSGKKIMGYKMNQNFDIDTEEDLIQAEMYLRLGKGDNVFVFDIDGVIAQYNPKLDYENSKPNRRMITIINRLYELGNHIVVFTSRGYITGIDWSIRTKKQLETWGLNYHELKFGKPNADYYIDDKMLDIALLYKYFDR